MKIPLIFLPFSPRWDPIDTRCRTVGTCGSIPLPLQVSESRSLPFKQDPVDIATTQFSTEHRLPESGDNQGPRDDHPHPAIESVSHIPSEKEGDQIPVQKAGTSYHKPLPLYHPV